MILSSLLTKRLEEKLKRLNSLRPLPSSAVQKLREQFEIEMTYNSNAIEGNSLTLRETFLVLNEGITIKGKPLKNHLEATNHKEALDFLYDLVGHEKKVQSLFVVCGLKMIFKRLPFYSDAFISELKMFL